MTVPSVPGGEPAPLRRRLSSLSSPAVLRLVTITFLAAGGGLMFLMFYAYLGAYTAEVASESYGLLSFLLFLVGAVDLAGALLAGRTTDAWGPRRSLRLVIGGQAVMLGLAAALVSR
ncbi:hypothetical protein [Streptomyces sp. Ac-502]|uniref:hypothetical protein n=1 Tax=Streptomyces sp. Ac-502 TaxID=3342801 RepID=UPI0038622E51